MTTTTGKVSLGAAEALLTLSDHGKTANINIMLSALLMTISAEWRPLIGTAIPKIVDLLKDSNEYMRWMYVNVLNKFSKQGKRTNLSGLTLLMTFIAGLQHLTGPAVSGIVDLLNDSNGKVRLAGAATLSGLLQGSNIFDFPKCRYR
jgi:hypothetical protein